MTKRMHKDTRVLSTNHSLPVLISGTERDQTTLQEEEEEELKNEMVQMWRQCTPSSRPNLTEWPADVVLPITTTFQHFLINEANELKCNTFSVFPSH